MKIKLNNNIIDKIYHISRAMLIISVPILVISILLLNTPRSYAGNSTVDQLNISIPSSCTLYSNITSAHTLSTLGGTYRENIGSTTLKTVCNDNHGFVVYAIDSSNNEEGNNKLASSLGNDYDIASGIATSGNTSQWSMKLSSVSGNYPLTLGDYFVNDNNNDHINANGYVVIPTTWTIAASRPSSTDILTEAESSEGSSMATTYAIYVTPNQPAGTYVGQVKYALLHPSNSTRPTTLAGAYKNAGKTKVYTEDPITGDSGYFYTMQDMTSAICNAVNVYGEASQTQLVDTRDGKLYWVTKLHTDKYDDNIGQCWMTENLDLDLISDTTADNYVALTSENTDLNLYGSMGYISANGYSCENSEAADCSGGTIKWVPVRSTIAPGNLSSSTWATNNTSPYSYDSGATTPDGYKDGHGYSGNYYNWTATIASNNSSSYNGDNIAANSICPKSWRLPNTKSMDNGYEFSKLLYSYGITTDNQNTIGYANDGYNKLANSPLYFIKSGHVFNGTLSSGAGYYSSKISHSGTNFYYIEHLFFYSTSVNPAQYVFNIDSNTRGRGFSARCLAK